MKNYPFVICLLVACPAQASIVTDVEIGGERLEVEYFAGSGAKTSYVVVDFAATAGDTHAFAYRYDGTPTAHDALLAIDAAGDLEYDFNLFDLGGGLVPFTSNFGYRADVGDPGLFWSYTLGSYSETAKSVTWTESSLGAGQIFLSDGSFDGWYNGFSPTFELVPPSLPTTSSTPEPAAGITAVFAALLFASFYRKRIRVR